MLFGFVDERMNMHTCTQQCCFKQCKIYTHILGAWVDICGIVACMKIFHYVETQHCWLKEKNKRQNDLLNIDCVRLETQRTNA